MTGDATYSNPVCCIQLVILVELIISQVSIMSRTYICLCISHRCASGTVTLPSGETQAGRFVSRQTLNNHCNAEEALYKNANKEGTQLEGMLVI